MPQKFNQNPLEKFEPEKLPIGWPWRLLSIVAAIFLFIVLVYAGLAFGYDPYLNSQIKKAETEIDQLATSVPKDDQEQFIRFYSQLVNLENLLKDHSLVSKLFPFLEQVTHRQVYYSNASLKVPDRELELAGIAETLAALSEQLEAFSQLEEIEHYTLTKAEGSGNFIEFRLVLKLKETVIK